MEPYLVFFFNPIWRWWINLSNSCKFFLYLFLLRINGPYIFPWIIKNRTPFACYRTIPTFDIGYTKEEPSLMFILEGGLFWLVFCVIFTVFTINFPFFVSWNRMLSLFTLLVTGGTLTWLMWTWLKKNRWVDVRDVSYSLSYQDGSFLISTWSLL